MAPILPELLDHPFFLGEHLCLKENICVKASLNWLSSRKFCLWEHLCKASLSWLSSRSRTPPFYLVTCSHFPQNNFNQVLKVTNRGEKVSLMVYEMCDAKMWQLNSLQIILILWVPTYFPLMKLFSQLATYTLGWSWSGGSVSCIFFCNPVDMLVLFVGASL